MKKTIYLIIFLSHEKHRHLVTLLLSLCLFLLLFHTLSNSQLAYDLLVIRNRVASRVYKVTILKGCNWILHIQTISR